MRDKAFRMAKNPKYDGYQHRHVSMACKVYDKNSSGEAMKN